MIKTLQVRYWAVAQNPLPPIDPLSLDPPPPILGVGSQKKRVLGPFGASRGALRAPIEGKTGFWGIG